MSDGKYVGRKNQCPKCKIIMEIPSGTPATNKASISDTSGFSSQTIYPYGQVNKGYKLQTQAKIENRIGFGKRFVACAN